jgi:hypothetical protein
MSTTLPVGLAGDIRHSVENLLYEYAARADELDYAGIGALMRNARLTSHGGADLTGEREISEHLKGLFATVGPSRHMLVNIRIDIAPDGLSARTRCLYNKWLLEPGPVVDAAGRYQSSFRLDGEWEFAEHRVESLWRRR